ncbi:cytochrome-c peroxidase [bacterium]|nr:MAG: cytochrome-c peroxidase [bacterium]
MKKVWVILGITMAISACKNDTETPSIADVSDYLTIDVNNLPSYQTNLPTYYSGPILATDNTPTDNAITDVGATLGRVLFYEKQLSINNTVACASCHQQAAGFSDSNVKSIGFDGSSTTDVHSMRLANAKYYSGETMFWNKRAETLEAQTTQPIQNALEMGFDETHGGLNAAIEKLEAQPYYATLFKMAFGDEEITEERMQKALAQFVRSMISVNSKFDIGYAQTFNPTLGDAGLTTNFPNYTAEENRGKLLFMNPPNIGGLGCQGCHQAPTFALAANSLSNGLDVGETTVFKSPSLKNIALDGAFMHDGRFTTLEEVVRHYSTGIEMGPALDAKLKAPNGQPARFNLSDSDVQAMVAFLETLTDNTITQDSRFTNPFK